ncbi:unnamed protein product [Ixodes hexagonus]
MYRRRDYRQQICPCLGCDLTFQTGELADHLKSHSGGCSYLCRLCFLVFHSQASYLDHVSGGQCNHGAHGYAACGVAGCAFRGTYSSLEVHSVCVHGTPGADVSDTPKSEAALELTCRACSKKFCVLIDFLVHLANDCCARTRRAARTGTMNAQTGATAVTDHPLNTDTDTQVEGIVDEPTDSAVKLTSGVAEMRLQCAQSQEEALGTGDSLMDTTPSNPDTVIAENSGASAAGRTTPSSCPTTGATPLQSQDDKPIFPQKDKPSKYTKKVYGFNVLYRCALCRDRFGNVDELFFHIKHRHRGGHKDISAVHQWDTFVGRYRPLQSCASKPTDHKYSCLLCENFSRTDRKSFKLHMISAHGQHCCIECGRVFVSKGGMHTHMASSHWKYVVPSSTAAGKRASGSDHSSCETNGNSTTDRESPAKDTHHEKGQGQEASKRNYGRHDCNICTQSFVDSRAMQLHAFKAHGVYCCGYCSWTTTDGVERLRLHHYEEHGSLSFLNPANHQAPAQLAPRSSKASTRSVPVESAASGSLTKTNITPQTENMQIADESRIPDKAAKVQIFKCRICKAEVGDRLGHLYEEHGVHACPDCNYCACTALGLRVHQGSEHSKLSSSNDGQRMEKAEQGLAEQLEESSPEVPDAKKRPTKKGHNRRWRKPYSHDSDWSADSEASSSDNESFIVDDADSDATCIAVHDETSCSSRAQYLTSKSESTASDVSWNGNDREPSGASSSVSCTDPSHSDDDGGAVGLEEGKKEGGINLFCCGKCKLHFTSRVTLVCHMVKAHQQCGFCAYCERTTTKMSMIKLHQKTVHRGSPLRYLAFQGSNLLTSVADASTKRHYTEVSKRTSTFDLSEEDLALCNSLLKKMDRHMPTKRYRTALRNDSTDSEGNSSSTEHYSHLTKHKHTESRSTKCVEKHRKHRKERKRIVFMLSSSDEMATSGEKDGEDIVVIKAYSGYRVPKSAAVFADLLNNVGRRFHCCMFSCSFSADSQSEFGDHLDGHAKSGHHLACIYCGAPAPSSEELLSHLRDKHWTLQHQCTQCLYRASCKLYVQCHFEHAHRQAAFASLVVPPVEDTLPKSPPSLPDVTHRPYECGFPDCHFTVRDTAAFTEHLTRSHRGATSFACFECGQGWASIAQLVEHLTEHGIAAVQCGYCPASADTLGSILMHLCYCHADASPKFHVRDKILEERLLDGKSAWIIGLDTMAENPKCVELQQRCYCCPRMVAGIGELKDHLVLKHRLSPTPKELADRLFASYDYTVAVQNGRCPFCPFVAEDSKTLQEHVLYQELRCIYVCRPLLDSGERGSEDDCELQAWAEANLCFRRLHYVCPECPETFDATSKLGLHVRRHYTYYPVVCKLCGMKLRGLIARDNHLLEKHSQGLGGVGGRCGATAEEVSARVQEVVRKQEAGQEVHSCRQCGFKSRSSSYIQEHRLRCDGVIEDEPEMPFKCGVCAAAFGLLHPLLDHGFWRHGFSYFCTDCYFGAANEKILQESGHPCRGRDAFFVEHKEQSSKRSTGYSELYVSQLTVVKDWDIYYKSRDFEYRGLDQLFVSLFKEKVMVADLLEAANFEGYVRLCDIDVCPMSCRH